MFDEINSLPTQREFPSAGPDAEPSLAFWNILVAGAMCLSMSSKSDRMISPHP